MDELPLELCVDELPVGFWVAGIEELFVLCEFALEPLVSADDEAPVEGVVLGDAVWAITQDPASNTMAKIGIFIFMRFEASEK
jgi:hypothetical protein